MELHCERKTKIGGINEGFDEAAADRSVINRRYADIDSGYKTTNAYNVLSTIPRILANSTGAKEVNLIKSGIGGIESYYSLSDEMSEKLNNVISSINLDNISNLEHLMENENE